MYITITPLFHLSLLTQLSYASRQQLSYFHALSKTILFTISPAYSNYIYLTSQSSTFPCVHHINYVVVCSMFANHIAAHPFFPSSIVDTTQSTVSSCVGYKYVLIFLVVGSTTVTIFGLRLPF